MAGHGAIIRVFFQWVAHAQGFQVGFHLRREGLGHGGFDDEALGGNATLARIEHPRLDGYFGRLGHVGIGQHHEGIAAAEFEDRFFEVLPGRLGNLAPGAFAARHGDGLYVVAGDDVGHAFGTHGQVLKRALRKARVVEHGSNGLGTLRHVGGVLEQAHVAGHQRGRGKTKYLPERKVPGHHGQHGAQRLEGNQAAVGFGVHHLVGQHLGGMVGVVVAHGGAFVHLAAGGLDHLAHFEGHEAGEVFALFAQHLGGAVHQPAALVKIRIAPTQKSRCRTFEGRLEFFFTHFGEGLYLFVGDGVGRGDRHGNELIR